MKEFSKSNRVNFVLISDNGDKMADVNKSRGINDWKKGNLFFIKFVSVVLSAFFLSQQIGWADTGRVVWAQARPINQVGQPGGILKSDFEMPYDLAETEDMDTSGGDETIIHIQDAHASLSAQYSIVKLLDNLVDNYNLNVVALEGAGSGFIDTSILKSCPDKEIREDTAGYLMESGYMSAGEFFSVTCDKTNVSLYGIEDNELYLSNIKSFTKIAEDRAQLVQNMNMLLEQISAITGKACSAELNVFNKNSDLHRDGDMSFSHYWKSLIKVTEKYGVSTQKYTELQKVLDSIELENSIDFKKANSERKILIDELSRNIDKDGIERLVLKSIAFKQNKISQSSYHRDLCDQAEVYGIDPSKYPNLIGFTHYITLYESVELFYLYSELEGLETAVRDKMFSNDDERSLYSLYKILKLMKKLYSMELTNSEYAYLEQNHKNYSAGEISTFIRAMGLKYDIPVTAGYDISYIFDKLAGGLDFYRDAEARNKAMLVNTIKNMRKEKKNVAALITGGYHTEGLKGLMKNKGLSFLVVIPKFELQKERPYIAILTNKKSQYEKILDSGKYQLAVKPIFDECGGDLDEMKRRFILFNLGDAVLKRKNLNEYKKQWVRIYTDLYKSITSGQKESLSSERPTPEALERCLDDIQIEQINGRVIIADASGDTIKFIAMVKDGNVVSFQPASSSQRKIFLDRRQKAVTDEEKEALEFLAVFDVLKQESAGKESAEKKMDNIISKLYESVRSAEDRDGAEEVLVAQIVKRLKGLEISENNVREVLRDTGFRIPQNWQKPKTEEQRRIKDLISRFIKKVKRKQQLNMLEMWLDKRNNIIGKNISVLIADFLRNINKRKMYDISLEELAVSAYKTREEISDIKVAQNTALEKALELIEKGKFDAFSRDDKGLVISAPEKGEYRIPEGVRAKIKKAVLTDAKAVIATVRTADKLCAMTMVERVSFEELSLVYNKLNGLREGYLNYIKKFGRILARENMSFDHKMKAIEEISTKYNNFLSGMMEPEIESERTIIPLEEEAEPEAEKGKPVRELRRKELPEQRKRKMRLAEEDAGKAVAEKKEFDEKYERAVAEKENIERQVSSKLLEKDILEKNLTELGRELRRLNRKKEKKDRAFSAYKEKAEKRQMEIAVRSVAISKKKKKKERQIDELTRHIFFVQKKMEKGVENLKKAGKKKKQIEVLLGKKTKQLQRLKKDIDKAKEDIEHSEESVRAYSKAEEFALQGIKVLDTAKKAAEKEKIKKEFIAASLEQTLARAGEELEKAEKDLASIEKRIIKKTQSLREIEQALECEMERKEELEEALGLSRVFMEINTEEAAVWQKALISAEVKLRDAEKEKQLLEKSSGINDEKAREQIEAAERAIEDAKKDLSYGREKLENLESDIAKEKYQLTEHEARLNDFMGSLRVMGLKRNAEEKAEALKALKDKSQKAEDSLKAKRFALEKLKQEKAEDAEGFIRVSEQADEAVKAYEREVRAAAGWAENINEEIEKARLFENTEFLSAKDIIKVTQLRNKKIAELSEYIEGLEVKIEELNAKIAFAREKKEKQTILQYAEEEKALQGALDTVSRQKAHIEATIIRIDGIIHNLTKIKEEQKAHLKEIAALIKNLKTEIKDLEMEKNDLKKEVKDIFLILKLKRETFADSKKAKDDAARNIEEKKEQIKNLETEIKTQRKRKRIAAHNIKIAEVEQQIKTVAKKAAELRLSIEQKEAQKFNLESELEENEGGENTDRINELSEFIKNQRIQLQQYEQIKHEKENEKALLFLKGGKASDSDEDGASGIFYEAIPYHQFSRREISGKTGEDERREIEVLKTELKEAWNRLSVLRSDRDKILSDSPDFIVNRIVAIGGAHGDYDVFVEHLRKAGLVGVGPFLEWIAPRGTVLVQTGNMIGMGEESTRSYELLSRLQDEAFSKGSRVIRLAGKREIFLLCWDRYEEGRVKEIYRLIEKDLKNEWQTADKSDFTRKAKKDIFMFLAEKEYRQKLAISDRPLTRGESSGLKKYFRRKINNAIVERVFRTSMNLGETELGDNERKDLEEEKNSKDKIKAAIKSLENEAKKYGKFDLPLEIIIYRALQMKDRIVADVREGLLRAAYYTGGMYFTHAGINDDLERLLEQEIAGQGITPAGHMNNVMKNAVKTNDYTHPIFNNDKHPHKGGKGIFFIESRDLEIVSPQVVGATAISPKDMTMRRQGNGFINIDVSMSGAYENGGGRGFLELYEGQILAKTEKKAEAEQIEGSRVLGKYPVEEKIKLITDEIRDVKAEIKELENEINLLDKENKLKAEDGAGLEAREQAHNIFRDELLKIIKDSNNDSIFMADLRIKNARERYNKFRDFSREIEDILNKGEVSSIRRERLEKNITAVRAWEEQEKELFNEAVEAVEKAREREKDDKTVLRGMERQADIILKQVRRLERSYLVNMRAWRDVSRSVADNIREAETELEKFFKSIRKQIQDENVSDSRKKKLLSHIQRVNELVNGERTDILERLVEIYAEEKKIQKLMDSGDFDAAINKISAAKRYLKDMIKKIKQAKLLKDSRIRTLITHFNYRLDILSALCACEKSISEIDKGDIRKADNDLEKAGAAYRKVKTRFSVLGRKLATGEDKMIKRYVQDLNAMKTSVETILHKTRGKVLEVKIKKIAEKRAEAFLNKIADENLPLPSETWRSDPVIMGHFNVVADKFEKEASRMAGATLNEADKAKTRENLADQIEVFLREADRYAESIIEKMTDEMVAQEYPTKIGNLENWNIIFMSLKDKAGAYTRIASDIDKKIKFYIDNVITRGNRLRHSPFIRNKILDLLDEKIRVDIIPIAELIKAPEDFDALTIKQMRGKLKRFRDIKSAIIRGTQDLIVDKLIVLGDVHGDIKKFKSQLRAAGILNNKDEWIAAPGTMLILMGDIIGRGAESRECFDFLDILKAAAGKNKGAVIPLIGNHELSMLKGSGTEWLPSNDYRALGWFLKIKKIPEKEREEITEKFRKDTIDYYPDVIMRGIEKGKLLGSYYVNGYLFTHAGLRPEIEAVFRKIISLRETISPEDVSLELIQDEINSTVVKAARDEDFSMDESNEDVMKFKKAIADLDNPSIEDIYKVLENANMELLRELKKMLFFIDAMRSGPEVIGGIFWGDYRLMKSDLPQAIAHTPLTRKERGFSTIRTKGNIINVDVAMSEPMGDNDGFLVMYEAEVLARDEKHPEMKKSVVARDLGKTYEVDARIKSVTGKIKNIKTAIREKISDRVIEEFKKRGIIYNDHAMYMISAIKGNLDIMDQAKVKEIRESYGISGMPGEREDEVERALIETIITKKMKAKIKSGKKVSVPEKTEFAEFDKETKAKLDEKIKTMVLFMKDDDLRVDFFTYKAYIDGKLKDGNKISTIKTVYDLENMPNDTKQIKYIESGILKRLEVPGEIELEENIIRDTGVSVSGQESSKIEIKSGERGSRDIAGESGEFGTCDATVQTDESEVIEEDPEKTEKSDKHKPHAYKAADGKTAGIFAMSAMVVFFMFTGLFSYLGWGKISQLCNMAIIWPAIFFGGLTIYSFITGISHFAVRGAVRKAVIRYYRDNPDYKMFDGGIPCLEEVDKMIIASSDGYRNMKMEQYLPEKVIKLIDIHEGFTHNKGMLMMSPVFRWFTSGPYQKSAEKAGKYLKSISGDIDDIHDMLECNEPSIKRNTFNAIKKIKTEVELIRLLKLLERDSKEISGEVKNEAIEILIKRSFDLGDKAIKEVRAYLSRHLYVQNSSGKNSSFNNALAGEIVKHIHKYEDITTINELFERWYALSRDEDIASDENYKKLRTLVRDRKRFDRAVKTQERIRVHERIVDHFYGLLLTDDVQSPDAVTGGIGLNDGDISYIEKRLKNAVLTFNDVDCAIDILDKSISYRHILRELNLFQRTFHVIVFDREKFDNMMDQAFPGSSFDSYNKVVIGVPISFYSGLEMIEKEAIKLLPGVELAVLESRDEQALMEELESARRSSKASASALINMETAPEDIYEVVESVVSELKSRVFDLANPRIRTLDEKTISEIENIENVLKDIATELNWSKTIQSLNLSSLSLFQMRIGRSYDAFYDNPAKRNRRVEYLSSVLKKKEEHYLLHYVDGEAVFAERAKAIVPAGIEIEKRRKLMDVNKDNDLQHDKFIISLPASVVTAQEKTEFRKMIMELWMLDGVIDPGDIVLVEREDYNNAELFLIAQRAFEDMTKKNTGLRVMLGEVKYTDEDILQIDLAPEASTNINQYEVFVNLVLTKDKEEFPKMISGLKKERGNLYIYLPQVKAFNLEREVKNYNRYVKEILVKA